MTITRTCSLAGAVLALALGAGACGGSDEEDVRATLKEWVDLDQKKDPERTCELMTPRAQAQLVGMLGSFAKADSCREVMRKSDPDEDQYSAGEVKKSKIAIRGDLAVVSVAGDEEQRIGMRKVDGEWRLDNMINPSLKKRSRRIDPRLSKGGDEQQLRATYMEVSEAFAAKDYERGCRLFSYGAEAQVLFGSMFVAALSDEKSDDKMPDLSCAASIRALSKLGEADDAMGFASKVPSAAELARADIAIRGERATVSIPGEEPGRFVREEGHWLVAADPVEKPPTPSELERCWRSAGAAIASDKGDLRFAEFSESEGVSSNEARVSVKGGDWRIFYAMPSDGEDPGLPPVLADPSVVPVVAYVKNAPAHVDVVTKARACGDD